MTPDRPQLDIARRVETSSQRALREFVSGVKTNDGVQGGVLAHPIIGVLVDRSAKLHEKLRIAAHDRDTWITQRTTLIQQHQEGIKDLSLITPTVATLAPELDGIIDSLMREDPYFGAYDNPFCAKIVHFNVKEKLLGAQRMAPQQGEF